MKLVKREWGDVVRGYGPFHEKVDDVVLGPFTVILGTMQVGKTTVINSFVVKINEVFDIPQLNLYSKDFGDIFQLHNKESIARKIRNVEMCNIFIDDTIQTMHSKKQNTTNEGNWFNVRHYFQDQLGMEKGTLNFFTCGQRYMSLSGVLRASPIMIFKPTIMRDYYEEDKFKTLLTRKQIGRLKKWANDIYIEKDLTKLNYCFIKEGDAPAKQNNIKKEGKPKWIDVPHNEPEEFKFTKEQMGYIVYNKKKIDATAEQLSELFKVSKPTLYINRKAYMKLAGVNK